MTQAEEFIELFNSQYEEYSYAEEILWDKYSKDEWKNVHTETLTTDRWHEYKLNIYQFNDESMVGIETTHGLTEYQDPDENPEIYLVEPYEVTTTKYRKIG